MTDTNTNTIGLHVDHGEDFNVQGLEFTATEIAIAPISERAKKCWSLIGGGQSISATFAKTGGMDLIAIMREEGMTYHQIDRR